MISAIKTVIESNEDVASPKDINALEHAYASLHDSASLLAMASDLANDDYLSRCIKDTYNDRVNNKEYIFNLLNVRGHAPLNSASTTSDAAPSFIASVSRFGGCDLTLCDYILRSETAHANLLFNESTRAGSVQISAILGELAKCVELSCVSLNEAMALYTINR